MRDNFGPAVGEDEIPDDGYDIFIQYRHIQPNSNETGLRADRGLDTALGETVGLSEALNEDPEKSLWFNSDEGYVVGISHEPEHQIRGFEAPSEEIEELEELAEEETNKEFGDAEGPEWYGLVSLIQEGDGENPTATYVNGVPETVDRWLYESLDHLTDNDYDPDILRES